MNIQITPGESEVLVVEDDRNLRFILCHALEQEGYIVHTAQDGLEAVSLMAERRISVLVSDIKMPNMDGMALLDHVLAHHPDVPVILITAHGTVDNAVEAMKLGAHDYIAKPFDIPVLQQVVEKAIYTRERNSLNYHPAPEELGRYDIIGRSKEMMSIYDMIARVADTPSTVLITGEHGTGKELVAKALHRHSTRRDEPFIPINCAAIPNELIESELFGAEKGAYTSSDRDRPGKFELAHGGSLFLDEIGEISMEMQVKLLRVIQEDEVLRIGAIKPMKIDVRLIAATNRDLEDMIQKGEFREDLFYRLNVVPIHLPPLRDRRSDIPLLVDHFLKKFNQRLSRDLQGVTPEALQVLQEYHWPGNIRELENVIERSVLFVNEGQDRLAVQNLPEHLLKQENRQDPSMPFALDTSMSLPEMWRQQKEILERQMIRQALDKTFGNVTKAAEVLGISRKSMQKKMKDLGLRENGGGRNGSGNNGRS